MRLVPLGLTASLIALVLFRAGVGATAENLPAIDLVEAQGRVTSLAAVVDESRHVPLLVLRVQAEWCGTCQAHAALTADQKRAVEQPVRIVDVLIADRHNGPADAESIARWATRVPGDVTVLRGEAAPFSPLVGAFAPLPWIVTIDTRAQQIVSVEANPEPAAETGPRTANSRFTPAQRLLISGMQLGDPPPDRGNRLADDARAAALGERLFFETRLAPRARACASCHSAELLFTNGKDIASEGVGQGSRNVPTILWTSHAPALLWDGRADAPWGQAVMPLEDADEMGSSRLFVAHAIARHYRAEYEAIFGALPALDEASRFPSSGKPGDASWAAMAETDRHEVSRVLANVGKAIAAFERRLTREIAPSRFDRFAAGETTALTEAEQDGLAAFFAAGCAQCHYGPRLSNEAFHNLRFPTGRPDRRADRGRIDAPAMLRSHEFSADGPFSDSPAAAPPRPARDEPWAEGAFRTPGLRGVALSMPYGHGGGFGGLRSVIEAHRTGGLPLSSPYATGAAERWAQGFDPALIPRIQTFLATFTADVPPRFGGPRSAR